MKKMLLISMILFSSITFGYDFYVSPTGSDALSGTKDRPVATLGRAVERAQKLIELRGYLDDGITIHIADGQYSFADTINLGNDFSGTADAPIVIRAADGANPIFNGGKRLDISKAKPVENQSIIYPDAVGKVYYVDIDDADIDRLLSSGAVGISSGGVMMKLSRYPNVGYGHIDKIKDQGAVYTHGRTIGEPPKFSMDEPIGGVFTLRDKDTTLWQAELERLQKAQVTGYLSYDWYKESHRIAAINDGEIKLLGHSRYGILSREKIPRRVIVRNLLCEVDEPGEFFYDDDAKRFYFIPFEDIQANDALTIWAGKTFLDLRGCENLRIEGLTIEGVSQGDYVVALRGCKNVELAGCTIRNSSRPAVLIDGGSNSGLLSCDIYDVPGHVQIQGGETATLTPAGNYAKNCHFTQIQANDFYGRIRLTGVGNIFSHNLVHNFIGQVMVIGGNDHIIEYNELFNIGFEEGDGGAIYSGAQMWGYGNTYRRNFLHHLMCLPQAHPRGGIYPDDLTAGHTIEENIFYKAAHRAILLNGGAAHLIRDNIFLNCHIGIYSTQAWAQGIYEQKAKFDAGELKRGDKNDHIWRTEQVVGKEGWNNEPWISKYPMFAKVMNQEKMRFFPIENRWIGNLFQGNYADMVFRLGWGADEETENIDSIEFVKSENNREISTDIFADAENMDFNYNSSISPKGLPAIQFDKIGLYKDSHRTILPDKKLYRKAIMQKFASQKSYDPNALYDDAAINEMIYFNTGKLLINN